MKGLLVKDIYNLKKQFKQYAFLFIFFTGFSIAFKSSSYSMSMMCIMAPMLAITALAFDDQSDFTKFAYTLPVSIESIVLSKYVLLIVLTGVCLVVTIPLGMILSSIFSEQASDILLSGYLLCCIALSIYSIMFPALFKMGVEKARMIMTAILAVPVILVFIFMNFFSEGSKPTFIEEIIVFVESNYRMLLVMPIVLTALIIFISYRISVRIMKKKWF